jgi:hypothetical protein
MSVLFHIKKQIRQIKEKYPFLKKHPVLFWLLLPVLFFSLKVTIAVLFGSFLVEVLNIAVPDWIIVMILAILLYLLIFIIYRLLKSRKE